MTTATTASVDFEAIKTKQQITWSSGNYGVIGTRLQLIGEELCEALDIVAGSRVLDVAAGNGNASLAAARRGCEVLATDYVPELLRQLDARAAAEGVSITTETQDAEALTVGDESFDFVLSTVGVMFAPNQQRAADELVRVVKRGGKIGLANWTPEGFVGDMFRTIGKYAPPPAGVSSPMLWGTEARLHELFDGQVSSIEVTRKMFNFRYRDAQEFLDSFRSFYGPMVKAFESLDEDGQASLAQDLVDLANSKNVATVGVKLPCEYAEIVITR